MADVTADRSYGPLDGISAAEQRKVVVASSLGTIFEWYDFYLYGSLAAIIGSHFFSGLTESGQFIFALLAFAAGFFVRPFGAIFFGRLGDLVGRKYTFLITIVIMGLSTFAVGILPSYDSIGVMAPVILIATAPSPGPRAWRRIWRRGDLCRRARRTQPPRLSHKLDPDHGDTRPLPVADRDLVVPPVRARRGRRRESRELQRGIGTVARALPRVDLPAFYLRVDSAEPQRVAGLETDEGAGARVEGAFVRRVP